MLYETEEDRFAERAALDAFERAHGVVCVQLKPQYRVDAMVIEEGKPAAFIEVKCRKNKSDAYPTVLAAVHKIICLLEMERATGLPGMMLFRWQDRWGTISAEKCMQYPVTVHGRGDRGETGYEPCFLVPVGDVQI